MAVISILAMLGMSSTFLELSMPAKANGGTIIVPDDYPTIQYAIDNATSGDTIYVRSGTYNESIKVWFKDPLTRAHHGGG